MAARAVAPPGAPYGVGRLATIMNRGLMLFGMSMVCVGFAAAAHLVTPSAVVRSENVPLGVGWRLEDKRGDSLLIRNPSGSPCRVRVRVLPFTEVLQDPPMERPELSWLTVTPEEIEIPARGEFHFDMVVQVPREKRWANKTFGFRVQVAVVPEGAGVSLSPGFISQFIFTTGDLERIKK